MKMEHIFKDKEEYMLAAQNIFKYIKTICKDVIQKQEKQKHNNIITSPIKKETMFIPFQKDKLFWSFYVSLVNKK